MTAIDMRRNKAKISGERVLVDISLSGQVISISGQTVSVDQLSLSGLNVVATVNTTVVTNISGQAVKVSGEAVKISGETVKAEISGQLVAISGVIDARISGQAVRVSGEAIRIGDWGTASIANVGGTETDGRTVTTNGLTTRSNIHGFDGLSGWTRIRVRGSGQGFLLVDVSGQPVSVSGNAVQVSGQAVQISGQTVSIDPTSISGLSVVASVTLSDISGDSVRISGEAVKISGEQVWISGQFVRIYDSSTGNQPNVLATADSDGVSVNYNPIVEMALQHGFDGLSGWTRIRVRGSGDGYLLVDASGSTVISKVSGETVQISGQLVVVSGDVIARISGQSVRVLDGSGNLIQSALFSGDNLSISSARGLETVSLLLGFDEQGSGIRRLRVTASGAGLPHRLMTTVSGDSVQISGQTVSIDPLSISGLNVVTTVTTNVSGNAVRISGEAVKISGETVIAKISGEKVLISGQAVRIGDGLGGTNMAAVGDTTSDGIPITTAALVTRGYMHGFDGLSGWTRVRVRGSGDGYLLVDVSGSTVKIDPLSISGLNVVTSVVTNVSGNAVRISGEAVKISGEKVQISGQLVAVSGLVVAKISGEAVRITDGGGFIVALRTDTTNDGATLGSTSLINSAYLHGFDGLSGWTRVRVRGSGDGVILIAGEISGTVISQISGEAVKISGEKVRISGELVSVSGDVLARISGQAVKISGEKVQISGQLVAVSGDVLARISGQAVKISGETVSIDPLSISGLNVVTTVVTNVSGNAVKISGEIVIAKISGERVQISGEKVRISGETIIAEISGEAVKISGETVISKISGQAVGISGETVSVSGIIQPRLPTAIITSDEVVIASVSGGTSLGSGVVSSVTVRAHVSASGLYWVGGNTTGYYANSGRGLQLSRGDGVTMMIDNVNRIRVHAQISGDRVSYIGQAY